MHDTVRWFGFDALSDEKAYARLQMLIETPHDGEMVWRRVFEWAREPWTGIVADERKAVSVMPLDGLATDKASRI